MASEKILRPDANLVKNLILAATQADARLQAIGNSEKPQRQAANPVKLDPLGCIIHLPEILTNHTMPQSPPGDRMGRIEFIKMSSKNITEEYNRKYSRKCTTKKHNTKRGTTHFLSSIIRTSAI